MTDYTGNDFYYNITIPKKIDLNIVFENENILAYCHAKPYYEIHIVVVPKKHIDNFLTLDLNSEIGKELLNKVQEIAKDLEQKYGKARILTNLGGYQDSKHLHFHVTSGIIIKKS